MQLNSLAWTKDGRHTAPELVSWTEGTFGQGPDPQRKPSAPEGEGLPAPESRRDKRHPFVPKMRRGARRKRVTRLWAEVAALAEKKVFCLWTTKRKIVVNGRAAGDPDKHPRAPELAPQEDNRA